MKVKLCWSVIAYRQDQVRSQAKGTQFVLIYVGSQALCQLHTHLQPTDAISMYSTNMSTARGSQTASRHSGSRGCVCSEPLHNSVTHLGMGVLSKPLFAGGDEPLSSWLTLAASVCSICGNVERNCVELTGFLQGSLCEQILMHFSGRSVGVTKVTSAIAEQ